MKYADKLKDPRWQKKRLKILERDNWACRGCNDTKNSLAVHHLKYFPDKDPWECPDRFLMTLCEECHRQEREHRPYVEQAMLEYLRERGFLCGDLGDMNGGFASNKWDIPPTAVATIIVTMLRVPEFMRKILDESHDPLPSLLKSKLGGGAI
jgi:hypothetical protein